MALALAYNRPSRLDFDVSSGTSMSPDSLASFSETSAVPRYSVEIILGLPTLIEEISDIYDKCRLDNWDGDGASAISLAAYMHTLQLLSDIPFDFPLPSARPDTDGYIELEWYQAGRSFSILIGPHPVLFWAGYYSQDKRRSGRDPFDGTFPSDLITEVKKVYA